VSHHICCWHVISISYKICQYVYFSIHNEVELNHYQITSSCIGHVVTADCRK